MTTIKDFAAASLEPHDFVLDEEVNLKIFDKLIVQEELAHLKDAGHLTDGVQPIVVFVVGQTGSGKTHLAANLLGVIQGRQPAHLIADVYKTYREFPGHLLSHWATQLKASGFKMLNEELDPEYATIIKTAPHLASPATTTDARKWLDLASKWAIQRKVDVLLESACRHPEDFTSLISSFHAAGYRVLVALMAVPECLSLLGTVVRYYNRLPEAQSANVPLRMTPRKVHYETYASDGLLAAADFIDKSTAATDVIVVRRNNLVAYQNLRGPDGLWVRPASALAALDLERIRPLPATEHGSFLADCHYVEEQKGKDGAADETLGDVEGYLAGLMSISRHFSSSYPALKPLDVEAWVFGKWDINEATFETSEETETVLPRNSILQESARVEH